MDLAWLGFGIGLIASDAPALLAQASVDDYDYWVQACEMQVELEKYPEAIAACDRALAINPKDARVWRERATAALGTKDYSAAFLDYDRVLRFGGPSSGASAGQCESRVFLEQYPEAISDCTAALQLDRDWGRFSPSRAWYFRGQAAIALGQLDDALSSYRWATRLEGDYAPALAGQCLVLSRQGEYERALGVCRTALAGNWDGQNPALARIYEARALASLERYPEALASYDKALALAPEDASLWTEQGAILGLLGKDREAIASHKWAVALTPDSSLALTQLCRSLNQLDRAGGTQPEAQEEEGPQALATCDKALQEGDGRWGAAGPAFAWAERGNALVNLGQYEEALSSFARSLALAPERAETWSDRAVAFWNLERYPEALASVEAALERDPNLSSGLYNKGRILVSLERDADAVEVYRLALAAEGQAIDPNERAAVLVNLSALLWREQNYPEALQRTREALSLQPDSADALFNQSLALIALESYDEAQVAIERVLEIAPDYPRAMRVLAILQGFMPVPVPLPPPGLNTTENIEG